MKNFKLTLLLALVMLMVNSCKKLERFEEEGIIYTNGCIYFKSTKQYSFFHSFLDFNNQNLRINFNNKVIDSARVSICYKKNPSLIEFGFCHPEILITKIKYYEIY